MNTELNNQYPSIHSQEVEKEKLIAQFGEGAVIKIYDPSTETEVRCLVKKALREGEPFLALETVGNTPVSIHWEMREVLSITLGNKNEVVVKSESAEWRMTIEQPSNANILMRTLRRVYYGILYQREL